MKNKVSIIIPAYNAEATIARAIDSVLMQTYRDVEIIVINDGSVDSTEDICCTYFPRIIYVRQKNTGVSAARNAGLKKATGKYIGFLDADDWYLPNKLELMVPLFVRFPEIKVATCAWQFYLPSNILRCPSSEQMLPYGGALSLFEVIRTGLFPLNTNTVLIDRNVFDCIGVFREDITFGEDIEMWVRIAGSYLFTYIDEPLCVYDRRSSSACSEVPIDQHGINFLYDDREMESIIQPSFRAGYIEWRSRILLERYIKAVKHRNDRAALECVDFLSPVPAKIGQLHAVFNRLPRQLWPASLAVVMFLIHLRSVLSFVR